MVGTLERLGSDLTVEREVLAEMLNLYLGIVGHRTNRVVNRLTALSAVFLPLTFLCGVYGMNFTHLPEKDWQYGYLYFWLVVVGVSVALVLFMRTKRWM
jgi:magnesium transporter